MKKIIECVPNISEGRDSKIIDAVVSAAAGVEGVTILGIDPGADTNRTVITFVGEPEPVLEAAFLVIKTAMEKIDMSRHKGAHPRMGATDVCPLIPVSGISMEGCAELARRLASRAGKELGLPVYLYGDAAERPQRRFLPDIRDGEYEALKEKLKRPDFTPDAGPAVFLPRSGATAIGARDFLLAYNINLNTRDLALARDIALSVRERGRAKRDRNGEIIRNPDGSPIIIPGLLKHCQAAGWYIDEYGYTQVTMNLTNYQETGLHHGFDAVEKEAGARGLRVTGSEAVGLLPKKALLDAGLHYLRRAGLNTGIPEKEIIHTAIRSLGLNETQPFNPDEKIIEYAAGETGKTLRGLSCSDFADELSSSSIAPGGGSVAALSLAMSAGLSSMVSNLTFGKKDFRRAGKLMTDLSTAAQRLKDRALLMIDEDTDAFNGYIAAMRLPNKSREEIAVREAAIDAASKKITEVPLETLRLSKEAAAIAETVLRRGIPAAGSDAGSALAQAEAAANGAYLNVMINLPGLNDRSYAESIRAEAAELLSSARSTVKKGLRNALKRCGNEA
ncbi:MAG: glutamate formimidoyltransferase [Spirochaetales bacterium]|nr:glutamate formimidoyltransferase [Spirochaetales bacterium]